jgi:uncharacterized protein (TIGR02246 family)
MPHSRLGFFGLLVLSLTALPLMPTADAAGQTGAAVTGAEPSSGDPAAAGTVPAAAEPAPTVDELHDELRAVRAAVETAINERDVDGLLEHVTPDVVFTAMTGEVGRGEAGIRKYFARMFEGEEPVLDAATMSFEPDELSILYGGDVAISFGRNPSRYEFTDGRVMDVDARWTTTLVRQDGTWKIAAVQLAANMFDNPVLATQRRVLIGIAAGAALVAFLVAFLLGRAFGRRRRTG